MEQRRLPRDSPAKRRRPGLLIDGVPGAMWAANGRPVVVFRFTVRNGKVVEIELAADADRPGRMRIEILPSTRPWAVAGVSSLRDGARTAVEANCPQYLAREGNPEGE
jgi:hypothetical protein